VSFEPTAEALRASEIDIANTARAAAVLAKEPRLSQPEDRASELNLRNTIQRNRYRIAAGLPLRPSDHDVRAWRLLLNLRYWQAAYGRRHPSRHIELAPTAQ